MYVYYFLENKLACTLLFVWCCVVVNFCWFKNLFVQYLLKKNLNCCPIMFMTDFMGCFSLCVYSFFDNLLSCGIISYSRAHRDFELLSGSNHYLSAPRGARGVKESKKIFYKLICWVIALIFSQNVLGHITLFEVL